MPEIDIKRTSFLCDVYNNLGKIIMISLSEIMYMGPEVDESGGKMIKTR